ncbi:MAG: response regulator [candidate division Zixibacteria bacterium]|nr:response regulator [candidate division Zixibacteria bacterium]MBU1469304.1 response regulator [candidate division Zixibacteria bacterium]MBU2624702.1 response regulator [candidate division Zixibacteria bacterium]
MAKKILIADQSDTVRSVAENLFRQRGFEVVSASDGMEALDLLRTAEVDLAFLNSGLPEMDGYTVSKQIKSDSNTSDIKTVLLLSTSEIVNQRKFLSSLADETLNKPFSPKDLLEITSRVLDMELDTGGENDLESDGVYHLDEDVEELDLAQDTDVEMDFSTIFADDNKTDADSQMDDIVLSDAATDDSPGKKPVESLDDEQPGSERRKNVKESAGAGRAEESIHLSEDQYGMQTPNEESEVDGPHDYGWFVREMKRDMKSAKSDGTKGKSSSAASAVKTIPTQSQSKAASAEVNFNAEEIGSSKINFRALRASTEGSSMPVVENDETEIPDTDAAKLSLAEKLLVREVADRLAKEILNRFSHSDLRQILTDVLASLKKM